MSTHEDTRGAQHQQQQQHQQHQQQHQQQQQQGSAASSHPLPARPPTPAPPPPPPTPPSTPPPPPPPPPPAQTLAEFMAGQVPGCGPQLRAVVDSFESIEDPSVRRLFISLHWGTKRLPVPDPGRRAF